MPACFGSPSERVLVFVEQKGLTNRGGPVRLFVTADDRTGALDTGAACAAAGLDTVVVPFDGISSGAIDVSSADADCLIADTTSRHLEPAIPRRRVVELHEAVRQSAPQAVFCHKLDSTLRGHWAAEVAGLVEAGFRVGIVAAYPAAGRTSVDGIVLLDGVPVAETEFAHDPLNPVTRSRPLEMLADYGVGAGEARIFDASSEADMRAAARSCLAEERVLVGTAGSIGAMSRLLGSGSDWRPSPLPRPIVFVCGSLHPMSRRQTAALGIGQVSPDDPLEHLPDDIVITSMPPVTSRVSAHDAGAMAAKLGRAAWRAVEAGAKTLVAMGGDTTAAVVGDRAIRVLGAWSFGMPVCELEGEDVVFVAKPGSFGAPDSLLRLLTGELDA